MRFKTIIVAQAAAAILSTALTMGSFAWITSRFVDESAANQAEAVALTDIQAESALAQTEFQRQVQAWKDILLRGKDKSLFATHFKEFEAHEQSVDEHLAKIGSMAKALNISIDSTSDLVTEHAALGAKYRSALKTWDESEKFPGEKVDLAVRGVDRKTSAGIQSLGLSVKKAIGVSHSDDSDRAKSLAGNTYIFLGTMGAAIFLIFLFGAAFVGRTLFNIIGAEPESLLKTMELLANGNLAQTFSNSLKGSLAESSANTQGILRKLIGDIISSSKTVSLFARQIADNGATQEKSIEAQSHRCSELAVVFEELSNSIRALSNASNQTSQVAEGFRADTQDSAKGVAEALASLKLVSAEITEADALLLALATKIEQIGGLATAIDALSKQTNLLSLNAAIEAARAGDAGRGFAVVADSVKHLAEKTASTSLQIRDITDGLGVAATTARQGMTKAIAVCMDSAAIEQSSAKLFGMSAKIGEISQSIEMIDESLAEQRDALLLATQSVNELAKESVSTASTAKELSHASAKMDSASSEMIGYTDRFKL